MQWRRRNWKAKIHHLFYGLRFHHLHPSPTAISFLVELSLTLVSSMDVAGSGDCAAQGAAFSCHRVPQNINYLTMAMGELKRVYQDLKERVEREEKLQKMMCTTEVDAWFSSVEDMEKEVNQLLEKINLEIQKKCLGSCCLTNCRPSYKLGKMIREKAAAVAELQSRADHFYKVAVPSIRPAVDDREMLMKKAGALDLLFDMVLRWLDDEEVGSIGIYGIGGVGKTTLLMKIYNWVLERNSEYDVLIWVDFSDSVVMEKVQKQILSKLDVPDYKWNYMTLEEKAVEIYNVLKTKKFLLFLDGMWEPLHLLEVGIPLPNNQNKSKVVLTTRSQQVCLQMEVQKMVQVECLGEEEAFALFSSQVGEDTLNSHPEMLKPKLLPRSAKVSLLPS